MFGGVGEVDHHFRDLRTSHIEAGQYAVEVFQGSACLQIEVVFADESALHIVRKLSGNVDGAVDAVALGDAELLFPGNAVIVGGGCLCHAVFPLLSCSAGDWRSGKSIARYRQPIGERRATQRGSSILIAVDIVAGLALEKET